MPERIGRFEAIDDMPSKEDIAWGEEQKRKREAEKEG